MNFCGLTDSPASIVNEFERCRCGSVTRVGYGLCLSCLLRSGLCPEEPQTESFDAALAEIDVRDSEWRLGNYQILEEIGRGGMGVIYRARQRHSRRIVALKRILSYHSDSRDTLVRFQREAEAVASLDHPNILPIYEVGVSEDGLPFFSMKFAPGGSLLHGRKVFRDEPRQAVRLIAKVARAIDYANNEGILHRDLKPGNILLDGRGEPLVGDFGLAKWIDATSDLTRTMTVFGTPGYIAPEQVNGRVGNLTPAVDIYSLGAILFELLSGQPPFLGEHAIVVIHQAAEKHAPKLRSIAAALPRDLETICARCLEREPESRYSSAGALAEDLEHWLEGRPIAARPVSPPVRLWRWSRRNPVLAASLAVCGLLTMTIFARQVQTHQLKEALRSNAADSHSITVLPFLDLDTIQPDAPLASRVTELLQRKMSMYGSSRVAMAGAQPAHWTGAALQDEIEEASRETKTRSVLSGTCREVDGKLRISLHLVGENGTDMLGNWLIEADTADVLGPMRKISAFSGSIYKLLESQIGSAAAEDPVMSNEQARKFFMAGRDLVGRRTTTDVDRAIACLENAVREEPRSISARSFLAMAYMGRYMLLVQPEMAQRGLNVAQEAVVLAPQNPTAHRALCAVYANSGRYSEALEHGFQSIEFGDRSERAVGQIAFAWKMLGRPDRAILWYTKAKLSQRQPADYDALLGDCWVDLCADDNAKREYESAATFHPDQPDGWMGLCRLKLLAGDVEGARRISQAQLSHHSEFPPAKQMAAMVEFFSRNFTAAKRLYLELASDDRLGGGNGDFYGAIDYCSALGRLEIDSGDKKRSRSLLADAIANANARLSSAPHDAAALYRLAAAESSLGETKASLQNLRAAIDSGWIDFRSMGLDPRFDRVSRTPEFQNIVSELATRVAKFGRQAPADSQR